MKLSIFNVHVYFIFSCKIKQQQLHFTNVTVEQKVTTCFLSYQNNIHNNFDVVCQEDMIIMNQKRKCIILIQWILLSMSYQKRNSNRLAVFNKFGLGRKACELYYYPAYQSFYDRVISCHISNDKSKVLKNMPLLKYLVIFFRT